MLGKKLEAIRKLKEESKDFVPEMVDWRGNQYSYGELASEFDLEKFYYETQIRNEEKLKNELIREFKIGDSQLGDIINGRYVRTLPR